MSGDDLPILSGEVARLRREKQVLESRFHQLVETARANEAILQRQQQAELTILGAKSLIALLVAVLDHYPTISGLTATRLLVVDEDGEIASTLVRNPVRWPAGLLFARDLDGFSSPQGHRPRLGPFEAGHEALFGHTHGGSVAELPLWRNDQLLGCFYLYSENEDRFMADMATDFLGRLALIIGLCLDNVVNLERLRHTGLTDALTGAANRRYLEERLSEESARAMRHGHSLSLLLADVDHFKAVNDTYGHPVGDEVLCAVAARMAGQLRTGDTLARFGGEEFAVLLPDTSQNGALASAERVRRALADAPVRLEDGREVAVTVSVGVASRVGSASDGAAATLARILVDGADRALYRAKQAGRNRVESEPCHGEDTPEGGV